VKSSDHVQWVVDDPHRPDVSETGGRRGGGVPGAWPPEPKCHGLLVAAEPSGFEPCEPVLPEILQREGVSNFSQWGSKIGLYLSLD
jgi:hypothetical protein